MIQEALAAMIYANYKQNIAPRVIEKVMKK